jgi:two-component system response regulator YesN
LYHIIVVDDESLLRAAVKNEINMADIDCTVIAEAVNGKDAIDKIRKYRPELILTDIIMPVMNGIDLIRQIRQEGIESKIIVLSNHDDYQYVRESLLLGASDYILKSEINQKTLSEIVHRTLQGFQKTSGKDRDHDHISQQDLLLDLLTDKIAKDQTIHCLMQLGLPHGEYIAGVLCLSVSGYSGITAEYTPEEKQLFITGILEALRQLEPESIWCHLGEGLLFSIFYSPAGNIDDVLKQKEVWFSRIGLWVERCLNAALTCGISYSGISGVPSIAEMGHQSMSAAAEEFYQGAKKLYVYQKLSPFGKKEELERHYAKIAYQITTRITDCDREEPRKLIHEQWDALYSLHFAPRNLQSMAADLLYFISNLLAEEFSDTDPHFNDDNMPGLASGCESWEKLTNFIDSRLQRAIKAARLHDRKAQCKNLQRAFEYINLHYFETGLSLQKIADAIAVNPAYLSRLFYMKAEETYTDYITRVRLEQAKVLLRTTPNSIEEISEQVGYASAKYFYKVFRDECGIAPTQYRKGLQPLSK